MEYPQPGVDAGVHGDLLLRAVLGEDGDLRPETMGIIQAVGYGCDDAAIETILNEWVFKPARKDGQPVPMLITLEAKFRIR